MSAFFGLLNLDKPAGMSSRTAVDVVERLVHPAKVGHAGTLDPIATGVLVVCVGSATRLISFVQEGRKVYRATFRFGVTSVTDDVEGFVSSVPNAPRLTRDDVEAALPEFVGTIEQIPPVFSAVHVGGRRAYELARRGEAVALAPRSVEIHRYEAIDFDEESQELTAEIECGSGTYVRSLGRDLAKRLGTAAVMTGLRRTAVGPFTIDRAISPSSLTLESLPSRLLPASTAVTELRHIPLDETQTVAIRHGKFLPKPDGPRLEADEPVALFAPDARLAAVATFNPVDSTLRPKIVLPVE
ncbi:MAG: tRNA pseudouridine(55) synthase TruB [Planctomycetota bacterium]|nr:tRNA pseudouridine(55) synthase TruB [Planctomycetaceae bacterium]MDQ3331269.1 tRNA pseudouridine(55) synthase TruB [Planctomycetota bacterium]